jgi:hypothetical protein
VEPIALGQQPLVRERVSHRVPDGLGAHQGLLQEVERAELEGLHRGGERSVAGQHDPGGPRAVLLAPLHQAQAALPGHAEIGDHDVVGALAQARLRLGGARGLIDPPRLPLAQQEDE